MRAPEALRRPPPSPEVVETAGLTRRDRVIVAGLVVVALALRAPNLGRALWVDESISIGISSHPVSQIPSLLRKDGSPPLFYFILHFWIRAFGTSQDATHVLPLLFSLAAVPVAYWAGTELFDRRGGLAAAALAATNPFLNWYATETRMYSMVVLLGMVGVTLAWRAFRDRRLTDAAGAVLTYVALLYTHNWALYLAAITGAVLLYLAWSRGDRVLAAWVAGCGAAVLVLWAPWIPSFIYQASNTAAPWAVQPGIGDFFADPSTALGGTIGFFIAPLLVIGSYVCWPSLDHERRFVARLFATVALLTTAAGFIGAEIEPSWTVRYLAVIVGPYLLAAAGFLSVTRRGRAVAWTACASLAVWGMIGMLLPNPNGAYAKSNVEAVAQTVAPHLRPGDVVVSTQTEQVPVLYHYLGGRLEYLNPMGPVSDPGVVNWKDIVPRLQRATPCADIEPTLAQLPVGAKVLEINPVRSLGASGSAWSRAVNGQVVEVDGYISRDPALKEVGYFTPGLDPRPFSPVDGLLYEKIAFQQPCR